MALSAAGIDADVQKPDVVLDAPVEGVLAWSVREGATNVIRHSGAQHCTVRIHSSLTEAGVEIIDDGRGAAANDKQLAGNGAGSGHDLAGLAEGSSASGHGLAGLAERAQSLYGWL
jgi:two-component system, NarL family, sensor histidine kinase DesK